MPYSSELYQVLLVWQRLCQLLDLHTVLAIAQETVLLIRSESQETKKEKKTLPRNNNINNRKHSLAWASTTSPFAGSLARLSRTDTPQVRLKLEVASIWKDYID